MLDISTIKTKELKETYLTLYDCIYGANPCYNVKDIINLQNIELELECRGIKINMNPKFSLKSQ